MQSRTFSEKNFILTSGASDRPITLDITFPEAPGKYPVVIYAHGFNGFKDWGGMKLVAGKFAAAGFIFIRFNFSHNGTTPESPEDFTDLEAYAQNTYTKELYDLHAVIGWTADPGNSLAPWMDAERIALLGHSRGGGIALIAASEDSGVSAVVTWASVSACRTPWGSWSEARMQEWKATRVQHTANSRTKQEMPLNYSLYEDYLQNEQRLNIERAVRSLRIPLLICHGTEDSSVSVDAAQNLHRWQPESALFLVKTDHVFGRRHPWPGNELPEATIAVLDRSVSFLQTALRP